MIDQPQSSRFFELKDHPNNSLAQNSVHGFPMFEIRVSGLSKRFNREWIFRDFSFCFSSGNTYSVTGPNGSGKSTLLHVLWGQTPQTAGTIDYFFDGKKIEIDSLPQYLSIATPYMDLVEEFTLIEQLRFHFSLKPIRTGVTIENLLDILYLAEARDKEIRNFSSGMKQRLKLGLAFYSNVPLIFLDEPGSHLDESAFAWYKQQLHRVPPGTLIFIGSNDFNEYPSDCQNISLLNLKSRQA